MLAIGILLCSAGVILKYVTFYRRMREWSADREAGMTWPAAWRKHAWYSAEDIPWMLLLAVGAVLIWRAYAAS